MVTRLGFGSNTIHDQKHLDFWLESLKSSPMFLVRKNSARQLGKMGDLKALPGLVTALKDPHREVRLSSVQALSKILDGSTIDALEEVEQSDGDAQVRRAASQAIAKIKQRQKYISSLNEEFEKKGSF